MYSKHLQILLTSPDSATAWQKATFRPPFSAAAERFAAELGCQRVQGIPTWKPKEP